MKYAYTENYAYKTRVSITIEVGYTVFILCTVTVMRVRVFTALVAF